jgi:hypothetical protein
MPKNMPYQLEKGPFFSVTESVLEDLPMRIDVLIRLRQGEDPDTMPSVESTSLDPPQGIDTRQDRLDHQNIHWYGRREVPPNSGHWVEQAPFDPLTNPTTGYWHNWYGNAEGIIRETYTRAIEVSLGIPHDPTMTDYASIYQNMTRSWSIEVFNRCPAPWFEGWVTWRGRPSDDGHVTVHLLTPSHIDSNLLHSPFRAGSTTPEYQDELSGMPLRSDGERGMWVISHEVHEVVRPPALRFGTTSSTVAINYAWKTNTAATNPAHGFIKANNSNPLIATALHASAYDKTGDSVLALSSLQPGDRIYLYEAGQATAWVRYVTNGLPVTHGSPKEWVTVPVVHSATGAGGFAPGGNTQIVAKLPVDWTVPWFGGHVWSHDDNATTSNSIVVVQPNEPDGGVLRAGRPYQP